MCADRQTLSSNAHSIRVVITTIPSINFFQTSTTRYIHLCFNQLRTTTYYFDQGPGYRISQAGLVWWLHVDSNLHLPNENLIQSASWTTLRFSSHKQESKSLFCARMLLKQALWVLNFVTSELYLKCNHATSLTFAVAALIFSYDRHNQCTWIFRCRCMLPVKAPVLKAKVFGSRDYVVPKSNYINLPTFLPDKLFNRLHSSRL